LIFRVSSQSFFLPFSELLLFPGIFWIGRALQPIWSIFFSCHPSLGSHVPPSPSFAVVAFFPLVLEAILFGRDASLAILEDGLFRPLRVFFPGEEANFCGCLGFGRIFYFFFFISGEGAQSVSLPPFPFPFYASAIPFPRVTWDQASPNPSLFPFRSFALRLAQRPLGLVPPPPPFSAEVLPSFSFRSETVG